MTYAVFLLDLVQDVAASRPVATFFRRESPLAVAFIMTGQFRERDVNGVWFREAQEIARKLNAELVEVTGVAEAIHFISGKSGLLLSVSESSLDAHTFNHSVFLAAPAGFIRVTLQHGLECVGFNHNEAHDLSWRHYIGMACDVAASWFELDDLHSVRPDQRAKVIAVGPPIGLEGGPLGGHHRTRQLPANRAIHGLVCENLHSVRFGAGPRTLFGELLASFSNRIGGLGGTIEVRPHPAGLYTQKIGVPLPSNARFNHLPLYKQSLDKFAFCISSPSSVLLDLVWANVPVAVWSTGEACSNMGIYSKLQIVSDESEWVDFATEAARNPVPFLERQTDFLSSLGIPLDIPGRYRELLRLTLS